MTSYYNYANLQAVLLMLTGYFAAVLSSVNSTFTIHSVICCRVVINFSIITVNIHNHSRLKVHIILLIYNYRSGSVYNIQFYSNEEITYVNL